MHVKTYDFSRYDRHTERMQLIREQDFDAYFEELDKLIAERTEAAKEILDLVSTHGCVMLQPTEGICKDHRYYVHPCPNDGSMLRYTAWDTIGPIYHDYISGPSGLESEMPSRAFTCSYK